MAGLVNGTGTGKLTRGTLSASAGVGQLFFACCISLFMFFG